MTTLDAATLNRTTLERQLLLERSSVGVTEATSRIMAIQAQEPSSPYLALQARVAGFDPADLDEALHRGDVLKATLMRLTLHVVAASDYQGLHYGMQPTLRGGRLYDRRARDAGLTEEMIDAVVPQVLAQLTSAHRSGEAKALLAEHVDDPDQAHWAWWAIRHYAPIRHHPTGGPWQFAGHSAFEAAGIEPLLPYDEEVVADQLATLIVRYLQGFGPASIKDLAQFTMLRQRHLKPVWDAMAQDLPRYTCPSGQALLDAPGGHLCDGDTAAPVRLLPMWDSILFAYDDRSRVLPEQLRRTVIRTGGDTLPAVLVDGHVAGVWRSIETGDGDLGIEVTAFSELTPEQWEQAEAEAGPIRTLLSARAPEPFRRFYRWWQQLPADAVVRTFR